MKIAVMAGTPIDSQLGEDLLKKYGYKDIVKIPISKNPVEQTTFQALDDSEREDIIVKLINEIKEQQCNAIFVYCNSLSSVVDFDRLALENKINIITPMQMYRNLGLEYKYLAVMAANSHGLTGVENNLYLSMNKNSTYASRCYFFILYLIFPKILTAIYISLAKIELTPSSFNISKNILSAFFLSIFKLHPFE